MGGCSMKHTCHNMECMAECIAIKCAKMTYTTMLIICTGMNYPLATLGSHLTARVMANLDNLATLHLHLVAA